MCMTRIEQPTELIADTAISLTKGGLSIDHVDEDTCSDHHREILAIGDAMAILSGKWKILVLGSLSFKGKQRFTELLKSVGGIRAKMLSKELQELEANQLVTRTVKQTKPLTVEYEITAYGKTLDQLITEIVNWGLAHRERIMKG